MALFSHIVHPKIVRDKCWSAHTYMYPFGVQSTFSPWNITQAGVHLSHGNNVVGEGRDEMKGQSGVREKVSVIKREQFLSHWEGEIYQTDTQNYMAKECHRSGYSIN